MWPEPITFVGLNARLEPLGQQQHRPGQGSLQSNTAQARTPAARAVASVRARPSQHTRGQPHQQLLDARGADRFRGDNETLDPVGGHIPGALNRPFMHNLQADGHFLPADALRQAFTSVLKGTPPAHVVHQCGSGVTACHNLFALSLAGYPLGKLYAGSWSEWITDPARAIATGD